MKQKMYKFPEYKVWTNMRERCNNTKHKYYKDYGGRGIKVCSRWDSFKNFLADIGKRPLGLTLERIDNDGNYEPKNCKWATWEEQNNNNRRVRSLEIDGFVASLSFWSRLSRINRMTITNRLRRGWNPRRAVFQSTKRSAKYRR